MDIGKIKKECSLSGFRPDKRLGQNFLIDENIRRKILASLPLSKDISVVEIGPGFGMMTCELADMAKKVYAVEKDAELCRIMKDTFERKGNIKLIESDILEIDLAEIKKTAKAGLVVYGNIPYNITAPIIAKIIEARKYVTAAYIVMQDEVAERLCAAPGGKIYGNLSCFAQYYARTRRIFKISKNCFFPKPKVGSCLVSLHLMEKPSVRVKNEEAMFRIIRKAFSERRKKVLNPLSSGDFMDMDKRTWENVLKISGVDPTKRAEDISLAEYARISDEAEKALEG
ncbi:MAG: 16S rRNA (adenine(1518)-N(6)/adenine(1519)-N(6))-dimethyltransferase RsmA [Candidatus Omnitrophota bacterium]